MFQNNCILVVEDDDNHFNLITEGFRRGRVANDLQRVYTAAEAVSYLSGEGSCADRESHPLPCLILLDLTLPGGSGFAVLEWVRAHADLRRLPIVVLTVSESDADLDRAYVLGVNSYLIKPFKIEQFRALVKSIDAYWVLLAQKPRL